MTRINVGIPPYALSGRHLIAEHREIKRVPNLVKNKYIHVLNDLPPNFRLGTGHVKFFYNKLGYLLDRYKQLYQECLRRGYKVQNYESAWDGIPNDLMGNFEPTQEDINLIKQRILDNAASKNVS